MRCTHLFFALLLIIGCSARKGDVIKNEDVIIDYTDTREGDTTLLFVHGWVINKSYWNKQVEYFSPRYRVVTIDLPGFGESGKNRRDWTVESYGKDISAVIKTLDLRHVILIGHSMSGEIIVEGALQSPDRVIGLVGVDNLVSVAPFTVDENTSAMFDSLRATFSTTGRKFTEDLFFGVSDSITRKKVMDDFDKSDPDIAVDALRENANYGSHIGGKLKATHLPVHLINVSTTPFDTASYRSADIPFTLKTIGGAGHFPMFEKPEEFNALLQELISDIYRAR